MTDPRCTCGRVQAAEGQPHRDRCFCDTYPSLGEYEAEYEPMWVNLLGWLRFAGEYVLALAVGLFAYYGIEALIDRFIR